MKINKTYIWLGTSAGILAASSLLVQVAIAQRPDHGAHTSLQTSPTPAAAEQGALSKDARTALDEYIKIQTALAQDSLRGVAESATAVAKAIQADPAKTFSAGAAREAELVGKARDLKTAREVFKRLSNSLIESLDKQNKPAGQYLKAFCSMAGASWLQVGQTIQNPYFGKSMLRCGSIVQGKGAGKSDHFGRH